MPRRLLTGLVAILLLAPTDRARCEDSKNISAPPGVRVIFEHPGTRPENTSKAKGTASLYESRVTITGLTTGKPPTFRGSIYPDDMNVKGRLKDGEYDIYLGFHRRAGVTPKAEDLVVRSQGFRAALIVQADKAVPVISDNPEKKLSTYIHIHNGFNAKRSSEGCLTLHPDDWSGFLTHFLKTSPNFADWHSAQTPYIGKKIGTLVIRTATK